MSLTGANKQEENKDKEKKDKPEEAKHPVESKEETKDTKTTKVAQKHDTKEDTKEEVIDTSASKDKADKSKHADKSKQDKAAFDADTIFDLEKNDKFTKVFESVSKYGNTSYDDQSSKPKKQRGALFNTVYTIKNDNVEGDYLS